MNYLLPGLLNPEKPATEHVVTAEPSKAAESRDLVPPTVTSPVADATAGQALRAELHLIEHQTTGLPLLTEQIAGKLGVPYLGILKDRVQDSSILNFPSGLNLPKDKPWPESQLNAIGKVVALYAIPNSWLLGIRGEHGDRYLRVTDIQRYRHIAVFEHLTGITV